MRRYRAGKSPKIYVILVLMLMLGMVPASTSAQDDSDDVVCEVGLIYDADQDLCLSPEEVPADDDAATDDGTTDDLSDSSDSENSGEDDDQSTEDGTVEDTTDTEDASEDVPGTVTNVVLHTFICPEDWDIDTQGLDASYDPCTSQPDGEGSVEVLGPDGATFAVPGVGDIDAESTGTVLVAGTWTISQSMGGPAWATCVVFDLDGNPIDQVTGPVEGSAITFDLSGGDWLECEWFVNGVAGSTTGTMPIVEPAGDLMFTTGRCAYGYDTTLGRDILKRDCTLKGGGGSITVSVDGVMVAEGELPGDDPVVSLSSVVESPFPSGQWTVELRQSDDIANTIVFCDVAPADGSPASTFDSGTMSTLTFEVAPGDDIACSAFVIELDPRTGPARGLTILGHLCPEGTPRSQATLQTCNLTFDGGNAYIEFDLYAPDDTLAAQSGLAPDTRQWTFAEVNASGTWRLVFRPLIIDTPPVVTCTGQTSDGQNQALRMTLPMDDQLGIDVTVGIDHEVTCDLLLFTDVPTNTNNRQGAFADPPEKTGIGADFTLRALYCPAGSTETDDLSAMCTQVAPGVDIALDYDLTPSVYGPIATDSSGIALFQNLPSSEEVAEYAFEPESIASYASPVIFCAFLQDEYSYEDQITKASDGRYSFYFASKGYVYVECSIYYIPADVSGTGANIYVQTRACGADVTLPDDIDVGSAEQLCPATRPGREFIVRLDGEQVGFGATNDPGGQVLFTDLTVPRGGANFVISEQLDPGDQTLRVFCVLEVGDGPYTDVPTTLERNGVIYQTLNAGESLFCSWFTSVAANPDGAANGPETTADSNSLTIQFWTCPDDANPADQADLLLTCGGDLVVRTTYISGDGDIVPLEVSGLGVWEFTDSTISATQPDNVGSSSVWCSSTWTDNGVGDATFPSAVELTDGVLTVTVSHPQTTVYCDWFLFGAIANTSEAPLALVPVTAAQRPQLAT